MNKKSNYSNAALYHCLGKSLVYSYLSDII